MSARTPRGLARVATLSIAAVLVAGLPGTASAAPATLANHHEDNAPVDFHSWDSLPEFLHGRLDGLLPTLGGLRIGRPAGSIDHTEADGTTRSYDYATWTSPYYQQGFDATQLVASWNAKTPKDTWLQVEMRGTTSAGAQTTWYTMGRWAFGDQDIKRTSVPDQSDANGGVDVDTFSSADGVTLKGYQLKVTLYRASGTHSTPVLGMVGAMTSNIPDRFTVDPAPSGGAWGIELKVPPHAQNIHAGQYPEFGGGGEAWCSPTSTEMVVEYWGKHPSAADLSWVDPSYADPTVDYAARFTYDKDYDGTGNWPFNTAYAGSFGLSAHVTRLHSMTELEHYIKAGIPVVTSQSFRSDELDGAGYGTSGHLMVVIGFTSTGDVIVNDPASSSNDRVRNVYKRSQFETIWLRTKRITASGGTGSGTGGIAYIIAPQGKSLPTS
ncbi:C39 family peptidase [Labedaea rhizosphaerae]|uniref:C39 family peptidase n=1 Tax=Labedaea rhizosphaerae TaxID=598644 RepID=UPI0010616C52|nr:C39 family peptidase [Labedaea rhizosphaerae]